MDLMLRIIRIVVSPRDEWQRIAADGPRLVAVYRVLEPHLVSTYVYHADATDPLTDAPTVRLLRQLAATDQSHVAWGQAVLDSLMQEADERKRALRVQADIEERLVACGGITGRGIESHWLAFHSAKAETDSPGRSKRAASSRSGSPSIRTSLSRVSRRGRRAASCRRNTTT
jgi:hypothetical protein